MGDSSDAPSRKELTSEELCKQLDKLLKENANNQRIYDWIEVRGLFSGVWSGGGGGRLKGKWGFSLLSLFLLGWWLTSCLNQGVSTASVIFQVSVPVLSMN